MVFSKKITLLLSNEEAIDHFSDTVYRVAFNQVKNRMDAEDVFQEVFLRFIKYNKGFDSMEHAKAWFIRTTINCCRTFFTKQKKHSEVELVIDVPEEKITPYGMTECVGELEEKYRIVVHLFYYEQYKIKEIAELLQENENTIKTRLTRAKKILKEKWQE